MSTTPTVRNPENLDPTLWEQAGLRPITEEEFKRRSHVLEWRSIDPLAFDDEGWFKDPNAGPEWTICVPKDLPAIPAASPPAYTVARLQEILDAGTRTYGQRRSIQDFIDQLHNHTP